ncbi:hypothetical protein DJ535_05345 [Citrobacter murliniae]|uniref:Secreted protein n=1 Tax=Citrobacter murliniae TaxID=67829 RepID=A0ABY2PYN3_9ENTR|nr:hypothetical protein DJ535_05345 [Citrobacter murliniae]
MCLLTFSLDECKEFAVLLFIFAKCAAPFRGKNILLHFLGATSDPLWCDQVAHSSKLLLCYLIKQLTCQNGKFGGFRCKIVFSLSGLQ